MVRRGPTDDPDRADILAATLAAVAMIAQQVGGKATRDALFLASFDVEVLPRMLAAAALLTVPVVLGTARALARHGPQRVMPIAFLSSALTLLGLWGLSAVAPRATAVLLYLHIACFGAVLVSGFWSLMNERFDPRTARHRFRRVASGGTVGGLLGGLLAAGLGRFGGQGSAMLPLLAILHLFCMWMLWRVRPDRATAPATGETMATSLGEGTKVLARVSYLRHLAALVVLGTLAAACLDYVFKASAQDAFGGSRGSVDLITFFGVFYTAVSLLTLLLQTGLSRWMLERVGLVGTVSTLPAGVVAGSLLGLVMPVWPVFSAARGLEGGLRSSTFRSGYEPLYTPLAPQEKRASKTIIDVGLERAGDAVGAGLVQAVVWWTPAAAMLALQQRVLLGMAVAFALTGLWVTTRLHRGYVDALERRLLRRALDLDLDEISDATTRTMILRTRSGLDLTDAPELESRVPEAESPPADRTSPTTPPGETVATPASSDPLVAAVAELRSGEASRVLKTLARHRPLGRELAPHVVSLLAWDAVVDGALDALRHADPPVTGLLLDHLLDEDEEFAIRRRIPRALPVSDSPLLVHGLLEGLSADRFEIRYQCAIALARIHERHPEVSLPADRIHSVLRREAKVDRRVWESHRLLDPRDEGSPFLDEVLRRRSNRSLEHVFTLLSLLLPKQPLLVAYKGLMTEDRGLRGTALEYLESVLPPEVRGPLWPLLDATAAAPDRLDEEERRRRLDELLRSNVSIQMSLDELRRREGDRESD